MGRQPVIGRPVVARNGRTRACHVLREVDWNIRSKVGSSLAWSKAKPLELGSSEILRPRTHLLHQTFASIQKYSTGKEIIDMTAPHRV